MSEIQSGDHSSLHNLGIRQPNCDYSPEPQTNNSNRRLQSLLLYRSYEKRTIFRYRYQAGLLSPTIQSKYVGCFANGNMVVPCGVPYHLHNCVDEQMSATGHFQINSLSRNSNCQSHRNYQTPAPRQKHTPIHRHKIHFSSPER